MDGWIDGAWIQLDGGFCQMRTTQKWLNCFGSGRGACLLFLFLLSVGSRALCCVWVSEWDHLWSSVEIL